MEINYTNYGNEKGKDVVLLHGWGQNIQMMEPIATPLEKTNRLIILDLPGFGKSEEPKESKDNKNEKENEKSKDNKEEIKEEVKSKESKESKDKKRRQVTSMTRFVS